MTEIRELVIGTADSVDQRREMDLFCVVEGQYQELCREYDALASGFPPLLARWYARGWVAWCFIDTRECYLARGPFIHRIDGLE